MDELRCTMQEVAHGPRQRAMHDFFGQPRQVVVVHAGPAATVTRAARGCRSLPAQLYAVTRTR